MTARLRTPAMVQLLTAMSGGTRSTQRTSRPSWPWIRNKGLSAARAAELGAKKPAPNALAGGAAPSTFRRLLGRVHELHAADPGGAAIVSLVIKQWTTPSLLFVISLFNAVVGLRQEGKARAP